MAQLDSSSGIVCTKLSRDINSATRGFENTFCKLALASRVSTWMYEKMRQRYQYQFVTAAQLGGA